MTKTENQHLVVVDVNKDKIRFLKPIQYTYTKKKMNEVVQEIKNSGFLTDVKGTIGMTTDEFVEILANRDTAKLQQINPLNFLFFGTEINEKDVEYLAQNLTANQLMYLPTKAVGNLFPTSTKLEILLDTIEKRQLAHTDHYMVGYIANNQENRQLLDLQEGINTDDIIWVLKKENMHKFMSKRIKSAKLRNLDHVNMVDTIEKKEAGFFSPDQSALRNEGEITAEDLLIYLAINNKMYFINNSNKETVGLFGPVRKIKGDGVLKPATEYRLNLETVKQAIKNAYHPAENSAEKELSELPEALYDRKEINRMFGLTGYSLTYASTTAHLMPYYQFGRLIRYAKKDVEEYLKNQMTSNRVKHKKQNMESVADQNEWGKYISLREACYLFSGWGYGTGIKEENQGARKDYANKTYKTLKKLAKYRTDQPAILWEDLETKLQPYYGVEQNGTFKPLPLQLNHGDIFINKETLRSVINLPTFKMSDKLQKSYRAESTFEAPLQEEIQNGQLPYLKKQVFGRPYVLYRWSDLKKSDYFGEYIPDDPKDFGTWIDIVGSDGKESYQFNSFNYLFGEDAAEQWKEAQKLFPSH